MSQETSSPSDRLALTIDAAVRQSSISRSTLYELMRTGELPYSQLGARRLILVADLQALLAAHRCATPAPVGA
jgi:excisionase family DNA binding protein